MSGLYLLLGLLILLFLRVPIAFGLGAASLGYLLVRGGIPLGVVAQRINGSMNSFVLLAVPFFMLAGKLMNTGGITRRIFNFANDLVGHIPGGLGHVNIVASLIFAGMSGSAVADAAGLGTIEIKAMRDAGFDDDFSAAVTAASSTIGPIIPPSIPMVLYGVMAEVSIGRLFVGGVIPGILMAVTLMIFTYFVAKRRDYPCREKVDLRRLSKSFAEAFPPLLAPVIIVGGILTGVFTPTEAAVVAVLYAFCLSYFIYRELPLEEIPGMVKEVVISTASIILIVGCASLFGWILTWERVPQVLAQSMFGISNNPTVVMLLMVVFLLFVGTFSAATASLVVLVPIFKPLMSQVGIDPVHCGVVMVLTLMIGLLTPPVGSVLYVTAEVAGISVARMIKAVTPYLIPLLITVLMLVFFPGLVTFLPNLLLG
ncbi:MAG: TRAP transporter large permease [Firmicutes bacterium]|nr:TRAP transporter large permease [Bacillota bacterium]